MYRSIWFRTLAAFGVISAVEYKTGKVTMDDYNGLYQTNPKLSFVMMIALFVGRYSAVRRFFQ